MPATAPIRLARRRAALDEDGVLLRRAANGDDGAFEAFHDRHVDALLRYCQHLLGSRHEAEDAVQQSFFNAYRHLAAGKLPDKPKAWLYAIARNRSLSIIRSRREQPAELAEVSTLPLTDEVERRADLRELVREINLLPEDQRSAIVLFELAGLAQADIAEVIGRDPEQVKSLVYQARTTLMARRVARETSCARVQQKISVARRGELNSRLVRNHVAGCTDCAEYLEEVRRHRRRLAVIFPAAPVLAASAARHGAAVTGAAQGRHLGKTTQVAAGTAGATAVAGAIAAALVLSPGGGAPRGEPVAPSPPRGGQVAASPSPSSPARSAKHRTAKPRPAEPAKRVAPAPARRIVAERTPAGPVTSSPGPRTEAPPRENPPQPEPESDRPPPAAPDQPAAEPPATPPEPAAPPPAATVPPPAVVSSPPPAPPPGRHDNGNHYGQIKHPNHGNHTGQQRG